MLLPDPRNDPTGKWNEISVARRAPEINAATLIQADEVEYISNLPAVERHASGRQSD